PGNCDVWFRGPRKAGTSSVSTTFTVKNRGLAGGRKKAERSAGKAVKAGMNSAAGGPQVARFPRVRRAGASGDSQEQARRQQTRGGRGGRGGGTGGEIDGPGWGQATGRGASGHGRCGGRPKVDQGRPGVDQGRPGVDQG